ncbi:unnamed protein product [Mytilus edulis]|uniref:B box-type domain-containing protein n=1 Tax=Mytilus edulis TaxID=6550 RepID=A0A8S3TEE4_MYTED|nr:unnamed protein product [Mytilus edulis]
MYGEDHFVMMFGGLHIEMAAFKTFGSWLEDSEWTSVLVNAQVTSPGTADSFLKASPVTTTRRTHQVTACTLNRQLSNAYCQYKDVLRYDEVILEFEEWNYLNNLFTLNSVEMLHQINNTTFSVKYEQSKGSSEGEECLVLWQLVTPANWNAVEVEEILTRFEEKFNDLPMKIKFVRNGSLVIMTTVSAEVFKESSAFQSAVKAFLTRMVEICHIDTHMSCNVDVTLHILESDKMNLTRSLSNRPISENKFVQTEIVESSTTPNPTVVDDESPMYGDDATFCSSCLHNYKRVETQSYCLDCSEPICDKCGGLHITFAPPHTITNKVNVDIIYHPSLTVSKLCSVHKNEVTNSFCTQHDALVCDICVMNGHSSCVSVLSIQKAAENVAEGPIISDLENRLDNLGIVIESLITNEEKIYYMQMQRKRKFTKKRIASDKEYVFISMDLKGNLPIG